MPEKECGYGPDLSKWYNHYEKIYISKGCTERKARDLACRKVRDKYRRGKLQIQW